MFTRRITEKDTPGLISQMGQDLEQTHTMVRFMQKWAGETGLDALAESLRGAARAINEATGAAQDAYRAATDKEARDR
ncbi:hypothetical protein C8K30_10313 [Promicromonospora sp. AC04]|uniref:hypothetical protein n=1 Tax=Promicromonospora sp. AC04 TaxID=2135723 RepID=UPI000D3A37A2|nr:hypothetical protein [Promicromonospora sp. AC04]PUB28597.1 hypothetical protein C8K30_10313 [Promicromonospora sp. AC04]